MRGKDICIKDLSWYFQDSDAAIGLKAQNYNTDSFGAVFDDAASAKLHFSKLKWEYEKDVQRRREVGVTLSALGDKDRTLLGIAFSLPKAWMSSAIREKFIYAGVSVLNVAIASSYAAEACRDTYKMTAEPNLDMVARWLESELRSVRKGKSALTLDKIAKLAFEELLTSLDAYDAVRMARKAAKMLARKQAMMDAGLFFDDERPTRPSRRDVMKLVESSPNLSGLFVDEGEAA